MKIVDEIDLADYDGCWGQGARNLEKLTGDERGRLGSILGELYPEGMTPTELNDLLWFDFESVCRWLGLDYDPETDEIAR